jgi:hypothetical protein
MGTVRLCYHCCPDLGVIHLWHLHRLLLRTSLTETLLGDGMVNFARAEVFVDTNYRPIRSVHWDCSLVLWL